MIRRTAAVAVMVLGGGTVATAAEGPDFVRDVQPILSTHCYQCHSAKKQKGGLRWDLRESVMRGGDHGPVLKVGDAASSKVIQLVTTTEPKQRMPREGDPLSAADVETLRRWINAGAAWPDSAAGDPRMHVEHWSFTAPKRPALPAVKDAAWPRNPIDNFILAKLEAQNLHPSPEADRYTLVRRVYLDLIGLPPTPEQADAFVNDNKPDAYDRLVDQLLQSPHYGERWARRWLDLARYSDTNGYEKDRVRSIWPYRDWVIQALNDDMPFDQFTVEQLAGDLLPNATASQRIATGFHRNTMINEEGGIDPQEFRFNSLIDRVGTTATAWLGLTVGCAQCHSHKYDPITQREFYQLMAFFDQADEPTIPVPDAAIDARRAKITAEIAQLEAGMPDAFGSETAVQFAVVKPSSAVASSGAALQIAADGSILVTGPTPDRDTYTVTVELREAANITAIRLEALNDPALPSTGPGRTQHGNFVLTEFTASAADPIRFRRAEADGNQAGFPIENAIDGDPATGWAIHDAANPKWNSTRTAVFHLASPLALPAGAKITFRLDQQYGSQHVLGKFRISLGSSDAAAIQNAGRAVMQKKFEQWVSAQSPKAVNWSVLRPVKMSANLPILKQLPDGSILAGGDQTKLDIYDLDFDTAVLQKITAIRIEALPDDSLPDRGPGRAYYEGPRGNFCLSEMTLTADGKPVALAFTQKSGDGDPGHAIDHNTETGWEAGGGRVQTAVFTLKEPLTRAKSLALRMFFEKYYAAALGRFRISVTDSANPASGIDLPADVLAALTVPADHRTAEQTATLLTQFLATAPELAGERAKIDSLRKSIPASPTTLAMTAHDPAHPRPTALHHRGEYLCPKDLVSPDVLAVLNPMPKQAGRVPDRLALAQWITDPANPLTARVAMNRQWQAIFGRGIVRTLEDFGTQGEPPTHPELLDWLATEFIARNRSVKQMHRLIVTSATYRQSSRATPQLIEIDPQNRLLARGPRFRIEAELVRDVALTAAGLLTEKIGGPSVFPPQPPGITEASYGPMAWNVSAGEDRYRRGLYTFNKRTAPYAMFGLFDAPSGESCLARRNLSDTPLQALTLLNDAAMLEAAQAMGRRVAMIPGATDTQRVTDLFRRCLTRPPTDSETSALLDFHAKQLQRLTSGQLNASAIAGPGSGDPIARAAWTTVARALLNLDATITKE